MSIGLTTANKTTFNHTTNTMDNNLKMRAVMAYPNAPIIVGGEKCSVVNIGYVQDRLYLLAPNCKYVDAQVPECTLILRSQSSLTDEECIMIYETIIGKSIGTERYNVIRTNTEINVETIYNVDSDEKTNVFIPYSPEIYYSEDGKINNVDGARLLFITDYLRSINVAVPFMGYDLIAEGVAIIQE